MNGQTYYLVVLAWGRQGNRKRQKVFLFDSNEVVDKLLQPVLRTRHWYGYQLADWSRSFPHYAILEVFQKAAPLPLQELSLFAISPEAAAG